MMQKKDTGLHMFHVKHRITLLEITGRKSLQDMKRRLCKVVYSEKKTHDIPSEKIF